MPGGEVSRGEYRADGTGTLYAWGEEFPRTWSIENGEIICINEVRYSRCYQIEQNSADPELYRARDEATGVLTEFRLTTDGVARLTEPAVPGDAGAPGAVSAQEMADKLANPTAAVASLNNNLNFTWYGGGLAGADDQSGWNYLFQPVFPFPQKNGKNILLRPAFPVIFDAPVPEPGGGFRSAGVELGDIGYDLVYGGMSPNGLLFSAGVAGLIPTATDDAVGADQWRLGPEVLVGVAKKWGALGAIVNHQWDIAGSNKTDTNITAGSYFYAFNLGNALQLAAGPSFSYNHEAAEGQELTLPLGIGLAKTMILKGRPWKFSFQYWNYVESPDAFAPKHLLRFTFSPVVEVPWGK